MVLLVQDMLQQAIHRSEDTTVFLFAIVHFVILF